MTIPDCFDGDVRFVVSAKFYHKVLLENVNLIAEPDSNVIFPLFSSTS